MAENRSVVSLRMLGGLSLEGPHGSLTGPATQRKRLAFLALLALAPEHRLPREKLMAYLWPESHASSARHQLSSALYEVRRAAGEDAVLAVGDELRLNPGVLGADVFEFESALEEADYRRAAALYRGPLLDGFFLSGAHGFEEWVDQERTRLAAGFARALEALAEAAEAAGDRGDAVAHWRVRAALDPHDSRVALRLMRALEAAGNRAGALQHAQVHETLLRDEFDAEPDPEVRAFAERLRIAPKDPGPPGRAVTAGPAGPPPPRSVVGRERRVSAPDPWEFPVPVRRDLAGRGAGWSRSLGGSLGLIAAGAVALLLLSPWLWLQTRPSIHTPGVLVVPFENRTGDPELDPLGSMAADWIIQGLAMAVPGEVRLASLPDARPAAPARLVPGGPERTREPAGAERSAGVVVSGVFYRSGDSLQFHTRITSASDGRLLRSLEPIAALSAHPGAAVEELGRRTAAAVVVVLDTRLATLGNLASAPANPEAFHACLDGLAAFFTLDWPAATRHFERSMQLDPGYPFPLLHIGYIRLNQGDPAGADSVVRIMETHRGRMSPFEHAVLDLLAAYVAEDPVAAYEAAGRAAAVGPGSPPNVQWGAEALRLDRPREAIRILSGIHPEAAPVGGWSLYWETLTGAHHALGQHRRELRIARRARALHPDQPWALFLEGRALAARGRSGRVEVVIDARRTLPDRRHPRLGEMKREIGQELRVHGRTEAAGAMLARAVDWYEARPAGEREERGHRVGLGLALLAVDRFEEAEGIFRSLVEEDPDDVTAFGVVGALAASRGDREEALETAARLAALDRPHGLGERLLWRACITAHLGDLPGALSLLQEAAGRGGRFPHAHFCLDPLRAHQGFRAFMAARG